MTNSIDDPIFLKVLVVGDSGVGKTSILNKYCYGRFDNTVKPTIGCDFTLKALDDFYGKKIRLQLWDIAGQERFHSVSKLYLRGAVGCIIVSEIQNEVSLQNVQKWKKIVEDSLDISQNQASVKMPMILLQNKVDILKEIEEPEEYMKTDYILNYAETHNFDSAFQVSAKENINIDEAIEFLLEQILESELYKIRMAAINESQQTNQTNTQIKNLNEPNNTKINIGEKKNSCC